MQLVKWNRPWASFLDDDFGQLMSWPTQFRDVMDAGSGIDIYETDDAVVVEAQLPGIKKIENVEIQLEGSVLMISAKEEESEEEKKKKKTVFKSTRQLEFHYTTSLPRMVDTAKAEAELENGVVKVTIPKVEEEKPKRIAVKKK